MTSKIDLLYWLVYVISKQNDFLELRDLRRLNHEKNICSLEGIKE